MANIDQFFLYCATLGPLGYLPASGTWATFFTILLLFLLPPTTSWLYVLLVLAGYWCSYRAVKKTKKFFVDDDPSQIVIDEVMGCLVTFFLVPLSFFSVVTGFMLFRFFDITKIGPVGWFEKMRGTSGIMLDDIAAGVLSNIILQVLLACIA